MKLLLALFVGLMSVAPALGAINLGNGVADVTVSGAGYVSGGESITPTEASISAVAGVPNGMPGSASMVFSDIINTNGMIIDGTVKAAVTKFLPFGSKEATAKMTASVADPLAPYVAFDMATTGFSPFSTASASGEGSMSAQTTSAIAYLTGKAWANTGYFGSNSNINFKVTGGDDPFISTWKKGSAGICIENISPVL